MTGNKEVGDNASGQAGRHQVRRRNLIDSVRDAGAGLAYAGRTQGNMRTHGAAVVLVLGLAWVTGVQGLRWGLLLAAIGGVLSAELLNTAIEAVVDLITENRHPLAKVAKDVAAAAVLVQALVAVALGYVVFAPYVPKATAVLPVGLLAAVTISNLRTPKEAERCDEL